MLTLEILAKISAKKKLNKLTNKKLAEILGVKYATLTMVLTGKYTNEEIEKKLIEWLNN